MNEEAASAGPDLTQGLDLNAIADGGMLAGRVGAEDVLLVRRGNDVFAVSAHCTHYHGPLADGLLTGDCVRCPWHHACFDLRTGEAVRAPALTSLDCFETRVSGGRVFVGAKKTAAARKVSGPHPDRIVIVGGGAAGFAAAEMLRREGFSGSLAMVSEDTAAPVDRPNLSKDYLAGSAPEEWVPLRGDEWYGENGIDLRLGTRVTRLDIRGHAVELADGTHLPFDRLLLATGAEPVQLPIPGAELGRVHVLRSLDDCRAIIKAAEGAKHALVIGASFIGLEVAASLRARGVEVHVVAPEQRPLEHVFGPQLGDFVRALHEEHGVVFHLQDTVAGLDGKRASLKSGAALDADLVVAGVGVRPRLALAEAAGLTLDRGLLVDAHLQTSAPNIYAAGDIVRWTDPHSRQNIRVEHWVVAQRQGQTAARNMLGAGEQFDSVPFFWSQHYDVPINYVGHAVGWDRIAVEGDIAGRDCVVRYEQGGRTLAVASIYRDIDSLKAEVAMERALAA